MAAGTAGHFVNGGINRLTSNGSFGEALADWSSTHQANVGQFANTMGGLTNTALTYGMTGNATLNVMNFNMFGMNDITGNGIVSSGLLEMNLGGNGSLFSIGTGGTDVSYDTMAASFSGLNVIHQNRRSLDYQEDNGIRAAGILRS